MENSKLVSIIIPVCNQKGKIKRCIDSILAQTYRNFEIILVDDCSTDDTMEYINLLYGDISDVNIIYIRNDVKMGFGASMNNGISNANGEYIAFQTPDTWWQPDKLKKQTAFMQNAQDGIGAVYGITEYKNTWGSKFAPRETLETSYKSGDIYFALLLESFISLESLMVRKDLLYTIGGFIEDLSALEDYELIIRIAKSCHIGFLDEILALKDESDAFTGESIEAHFYLMKLYQEDFGKFDMKKRKFESVYEEACKYGKRHLFFQCVTPLLEDEDYVILVKEKIELLNPSSHPEQIATKNISGVAACTGCAACLNICPTDAICMKYDAEGFLIPVIDRDKCVGCGKCKAVCPVCNEIADKGVLLPDECYAVMGETQIRKKSSSGGIFGMLAEHILAEGGYVAGAVWNENWQVGHIVSNDSDEVERMRSSKYVQSNVGMAYRKIAALLEERQQVLFTGCACQIAGLKCYLGKEYDNLLLAEVVCHGVPSQAVFDSYIKNPDAIDDISFRDKDIFGWGVGLYIKWQDGREYRGEKNDSYMFGFLNNWFLRKSCYDCKFKNKKYSDIAIGDFWGINQMLDFDDGLGTSLVILNTKKGVANLEKIRNQFEKVTCLRTIHAVQYNKCIRESFEMPACREMFFAQWKKTRDTARAIKAVKEQIHFDIAVVVFWSMNYGNALTNYALYRYLQKQGKSVVILDDCIRPQKQFKEFAQNHYILSSKYFTTFQYDMLNHSCETFVAGSDQAWNCKKYEEDWNYFYLDFVADDRKKVSYSASFGKPECMMEPERGRKYLGRFHAVSVREEFAVEKCEQMYGLCAQKVLDPVFLLEKEDYGKLIEAFPPVEEPYIVTYLLNPTEEKRKLCLDIQKRLDGIQIINMIDAAPSNQDYNRKMLEYDNIKADLTVEEWLYYMRYSRFVITDSFHGTCFAMIFEKDFITFKARETERFETFSHYPEISARILEEGGAEREMEYLLLPIDYTKVNSRLEMEKEASKQFIRENIL